jgi:ABC-type amino acid transport substrate-binding protein
MKILNVILLSFMMLLLACGEQKSHDKIVVATSADYPPFEYRKEGKIVGFEIDLVKEFAHSENLELEVIDVEFSGLVPMLSSKRVDMLVSAIAETPERKNSVDFSDIYYHSKLAFLSNSKSPLHKLSDMQGKKIGVQTATVIEVFLKNYAKDIVGLNIYSLNKTNQLVEDLKIGRIDAVLLDNDQALEFANVNKDLVSHAIDDNLDYGYAAAFAKGSELREKFNKFLVNIKNSGKLDQIKSKWFQ